MHIITVMRIKKAGGKRHKTAKGYEQAPVGAASRVAARTGISRRRGVCARLLLPAQYAAGRILAEKLCTAAAAGRATTLAGNGSSAPRCAPPAALAAPGAGEAARLRARGKGNAACGRDGHTGEHPARVKYTACGGSCLMISGAARAGHGDATPCGRSPTTHTPPKERTLP